MIHTLQTTRVPQKTTISVMQKVMSWFYFYQSVCRSNRRSVRCSIHRYIAPFHFWRVKCCCWTLICHPTVGDLFTHSILLYTFLDAFSHLYKRVCLSVHQYVRRSVSPSVRPSVGHKCEMSWNHDKMPVLSNNEWNYKLKYKHAREGIYSPNSVRLVFFL